MIFTKFRTLQQLFWKIRTQVEYFFHRGQFDPGRLTRGPGATWAGQPGLVGWARPRPTGSQAPRRRRSWRRLRRGKRKGKGSRRTGGSPWVRRWARFGRRVASGGEFGGGELGSPARNPAKRRRLRAIPWAGRKRAASGTFSASRRSKGRHRMATLGGSHGGGALLLGTFT
jgi:hypothetical protein